MSGNRRCEADHAAHGARSESESHAIERRKTQSWEPLPFDDQGPRCCTLWSGASSPAGVGLEHVQTDMRFPRNLGDPVASSATSGWRYRIINSRPWRCTRPSGSELNECNRGIAKRRKRSAARWVTGSHSVLILPLKLANFTPLEPVEGSETSNHGAVFGKHDECIETRKTCTRNKDG